MNLVVNCLHPEGLTPDEQVFLQLLSKKDYSLLEDLHSKDLLKINKDTLVETGFILSWHEDFSKIIVSTQRVKKVDSVSSWIDRYRNVFKDKKAGSMGSKKSCIEKMEKFVKEYPEYNNPDLIVSAAERYVNTQKSSQYMYLQQADYVISKKDYGGTNSRLATFCEEVLSLSNITEKFNPAGRQTI